MSEGNHKKNISPVWEELKQKVRFRLINREQNQEYLKSHVHREYLDLAAVFGVEAADLKAVKALVPVTETMASEWGVTADDLWAAALANLEEEECIVVDIRYMIPGGIEENREDINMYVCMTQDGSGNGGAGAILKKDLLKQFAGEHKEKIYILPSSVHEMLLVPDDGKGVENVLKEMVEEVNDGFRYESPEEWLSDSVYYYDREKDEVRIAA